MKSIARKLVSTQINKLYIFLLLLSFLIIAVILSDQQEFYISLSELLIPLDCKNLAYDQSTGRFDNGEYLDTRLNQNLKTTIRFMHGLTYEAYGDIMLCNIDSKSSLLIHKLIIPQGIYKNHIYLMLLDENLFQTKHASLLFEIPSISCNQNPKLTKEHILYLTCQDDLNPSYSETYFANLNAGTSNKVSNNQIGTFIKKDIGKVQTGPNYAYCYPETLQHIPDFLLTGFSCESSLDVPTRIMVEGNLGAVKTTATLGTLNYCRLDNGQILASYPDLKSSTAIQYFYLLDSNYEIIGQSKIQGGKESLYCQKPALITRDKVITGDTIVYYKCGFRGLDLFKLNMTKGTSELLMPHRCY